MMKKGTEIRSSRVEKGPCFDIFPADAVYEGDAVLCH